MDTTCQDCRSAFRKLVEDEYPRLRQAESDMEREKWLLVWRWAELVGAKDELRKAYPAGNWPTTARVRIEAETARCFRGNQKRDRKVHELREWREAIVTHLFQLHCQIPPPSWATS